MRNKISLSHSFDEIICLDNLLAAWREFVRGKRDKKDVQEFQRQLMDNLIALNSDLASGRYRHGGYRAFHICDPKPRHIHKASVRDRLVHHAIYRVLYPYFDRRFIPDSYSCRLDKGTHKALARFRSFACSVSQNNTRACWVLKGDIRKFFASIDHDILKGILAEHILDKNILGFIDEVIDSFSSVPLLSKEGIGVVMNADKAIDVSKPPLTCLSGRQAPPWKGGEKVGLPLGNLTSQLLVNIYLNKFDQFVKHQLKTKYYIRYADDFVIMSDNKNDLTLLLGLIRDYLSRELKLELHNDKISICTLSSGIDFLGWINFYNHRVLRAKTKRRMFRRLRSNFKAEAVNSYLGLLSHGNAYELREQIAKLADFC